MSCSTFLPSILVHHTYFHIDHQFQEVNNNYVLIGLNNEKQK